MPFKTGTSFSLGDSASTTRIITPRPNAAGNEVIIVIFYIESVGQTVSLSPGVWYKLPSACGQQNSSTPVFESHVFAYRQTTGDSGDITLSWDGTSQWNTVIGGVYTGEHQVSALDTSAFVANGTSTAVLSAPAITYGFLKTDEIATGHNVGARTHVWTSGTERADLGGQSFADRVSAGLPGVTAPSITATLSAAEFWSSGHVTLRQQEQLPAPSNMRHPGRGIYRQFRHHSTIPGFNFAIGGGPVSYSLVADPGTYNLTGTDVSLRVARTISATAGTYNISGSVVGLKRGYTLSAGVGTYIVAGSPVALRAARTIVAGSGTYTISGQPVTLRAGRSLLAGSGTYIINGQPVTLRAGRRISAAAGSYVINGSSVGLKRGYTLLANSGSYLISGSDVSFVRPATSYTLVADPGTYNISGTSVTLRVGRRLVTLAGSYNISGSDANATFSKFPSGSGTTVVSTPQIIND